MKQTFTLLLSLFYLQLLAQSSTSGIGVLQQSSLISWKPLVGVEVVGARPFKPRWIIEANSLFAAGRSTNGDVLQVVRTRTHKHQLTVFYKLAEVKMCYFHFGLGAGVVSEKTRYPELIDYNTTPVTVNMQFHQFIQPTIGAALSLSTRLGRKSRYLLALVGRFDVLRQLGQPIPDVMSLVRRQNSSGGWSMTPSEFKRGYPYYSLHVRLLKTLNEK